MDLPLRSPLLAFAESCNSDSDCPFQSLCGSDELCAHKSLLPLTVADTAVWVLIFATSGLANAAGIAGGSVMIPLMIFLGGFPTFQAIPLVQVVAWGGVFISVLYRIRLKHPTKNQPRIDFSIAMHLNLPLVLGTSYGVMANKMMPEWLILVGLVVTLGYSASKMLQKAIAIEAQGNTAICKPLLPADQKPPVETMGEVKYPWNSIALLVGMFLFILLAVTLRGGYGMKSAIGIENCTSGYWIYTLLYTLICLILMAKSSALLVRSPPPQQTRDDLIWTYASCAQLAGIGLAAGFATGVLGLTGGVFVAPLLLMLGVRPEVSASTCSFLIFFTCTIASLQFLVSGLVTVDYGLYYCTAAMSGSYLGVATIEKWMERRKSVGVFALALVMGLSTALICLHGGLQTYSKVSAGGMDWGFSPYFVMEIWGDAVFAITDLCRSDSNCAIQNFCGAGGVCEHKTLWPLSVLDWAVWVLIFATSGLANAAGLAGGSVMIPVVILLGGFSTFRTLPMVQLIACGGVGVALLYRLRLKHPTKNRPRIDYNIAMHMNLPLLLGTSFGVMVNKTMPEWLVLAGLVATLGFSAFKMIQKGYAIDAETKANKDLNKQLISTVTDVDAQVKVPMRAVCFLGFSFLFLLVAVLLRGGSGLKSLIGIEKCTPGYWLFTLVYSLLSLGLMLLTSLLLVRQTKGSDGGKNDAEDDVQWTYPICFRLLIVGLIAGFLTGVLGLTGGVFIAPLLLTLGIIPEVAASTCTLLVFFTSSIAFLQFATAGMVAYAYGLFLFLAAVLGSLLGVTVIERAIARRRSVGVFALALVLCLSTVLIALHGGLRTYDRLSSHSFKWGFRDFCSPLPLHK